MSWIFAILALIAATLATLAQDLKYSILCMWLAGLGVGAIFLTVDAEFLGIIQWIISTLVAISFVFFAVMFGDFESSKEKKESRNYLLTFCSVALGLVFSGLVWLATDKNFTDDASKVTTVIDVKTIGKTLVSTHFLSLEILTMTLFLVLIGCGAITKIEKSDTK